MILNFSKKIILGIAVATAVTAGLSAMECYREVTRFQEETVCHALRLSGTGAVTLYACTAAAHPLVAVAALGCQAVTMYYANLWGTEARDRLIELRRISDEKVTRRRIYEMQAQKSDLAYITKNVAIIMGVITVMKLAGRYV